MRKILTAAAAVALITAPSVAISKPKPSGLELQQIQSRDFEGSYDAVFRSVVSVLQDAGYRIQNSDKESGLITGSASTKSGVSYSLIGGWGKKKKTPVVSAVVEPRGQNQARVRLTFVMAKTKSTLYGMSSADERPITDAAIYQDAFEKIGQALFVRQAMDAPTTPATETPAPTPAAVVSPQ